MYCSKCGKKLKGDARFCSACGERVIWELPPMQEGEVTQEKPEKKKKTGLVIGLVAGLAVVLAVGGLTAFLLSRPVSRIGRAFAAGNVDKAVQLYDKVTSEKDKDKVTDQACSFAVRMKDDYLNEVNDMDYDTISEAFKKLDTGITEGNQDIAEIRDLVERVATSRYNYRKAKEQEDAGNDARAYELYSHVIEEDVPYYEPAQNSMVELGDRIRENAVKKVRSYADEGDFDKAQTALDDAKNILKGDSELLVVQKELTQRIIDDLADSAAKAIKEEHYTDALAIINDALQKYPDAESILKVKTDIPKEAYLIGTWEMTCDVGDLFRSYYEDSIFLNEPLNVTFYLLFREDGTYYLTVERKSFEDAYTKFTTEFLYMAYEKNGMSREEVDEMVEDSFGMTLEEYTRMVIALGDDFEELPEELSETGSYTVEGNRLYMDDNEYYEIFTVSDDTLTLDLPGADAGMEIVPGLSYPITLYRVNDVMKAEGSI